MNPTALKIETPVGVCFAVFPDNAISCELKGVSSAAVAYVSDNLFRMFKPHGYPIDLENIEIEDFAAYCHRPDLNILINHDFDESELEAVLA